MFLKEYREAGNVTAACAAAGIGRRTHYNWLDRDADYGQAFHEADEAAADALEAEAFRRAVTGVEEPVFQGDKQVGTTPRYSDRLLEMLLRARRPEKYRDRASVEHTGHGGGPILARIAGLSDVEAAELDSPED